MKNEGTEATDQAGAEAKPSHVEVGAARAWKIIQDLGVLPPARSEFGAKGDGLLDGDASWWGPDRENLPPAYQRARPLLEDLVAPDLPAQKHLVGFKLDRPTVVILHTFARAIEDIAAAYGMSPPTLSGVANLALLEFIHSWFGRIDKGDPDAPPIEGLPTSGWRMAWLRRRGLLKDGQSPRKVILLTPANLSGEADAAGGERS